MESDSDPLNYRIYSPVAFSAWFRFQLQAPILLLGIVRIERKRKKTGISNSSSVSLLGFRYSFFLSPHNEAEIRCDEEVRTLFHVVLTFEIVFYLASHSSLDLLISLSLHGLSVWDLIQLSIKFVFVLIFQFLPDSHSLMFT